MAWGDNVADWKTLLENLGMLEFFRDTAIPASLEELLSNGNWEAILHAYSQQEFAAENVEFLRAVATFEASGDLNQAAEIYKAYVSSDAASQVNLPAQTRKDLEDIFGPGQEGIGPPNLFDSAKHEITNLLRRDTFVRFRTSAEAAQKKIAKEFVDANSVTDADFDWDNIEGRGGSSGSRGSEGMTIAQIDRAAVATANAAAMKDLAVGAELPFVQAADLVLVGTGHNPQYNAVLREQESSSTGQLIMRSKGGAFSPGQIEVKGSKDPAAFEAAIRESTKKKIDFKFA